MDVYFQIKIKRNLFEKKCKKRNLEQILGERLNLDFSLDFAGNSVSSIFRVGDCVSSWFQRGHIEVIDVLYESWGIEKMHNFGDFVQIKNEENYAKLNIKEIKNVNHAKCGCEPLFYSSYCQSILSTSLELQFVFAECPFYKFISKLFPELKKFYSAWLLNSDKIICNATHNENNKNFCRGNRFLEKRNLLVESLEIIQTLIVEKFPDLELNVVEDRVFVGFKNDKGPTLKDYEGLDFNKLSNKNQKNIFLKNEDENKKKTFLKELNILKSFLSSVPQSLPLLLVDVFKSIYIYNLDFIFFENLSEKSEILQFLRTKNFFSGALFSSRQDGSSNIETFGTFISPMLIPKGFFSFVFDPKISSAGNFATFITKIISLRNFLKINVGCGNCGFIFVLRILFQAEGKYRKISKETNITGKSSDIEDLKHKYFLNKNLKMKNGEIFTNCFDCKKEINCTKNFENLIWKEFEKNTEEAKIVLCLLNINS